MQREHTDKDKVVFKRTIYTFRWISNKNIYRKRQGIDTQLATPPCITTFACSCLSWSILLCNTHRDEIV